MKTVLTQLLLSLSMAVAEIDIAQIQDNVMQQIPQSMGGRAVDRMDPSTFTKEVLRCQQHCGDGYYQCFMSCEDSRHSTHPTKAFLEAKSRHGQKWSSYLLKLLTFGFLGDDETHLDEGDKIYYESRYIGDENGMNDNVCLKNCTKLFRTCYRHCVCKSSPDEVKCMSDLVATNVPRKAESDSGFGAKSDSGFGAKSDSGFTARFDYVTQQKQQEKDQTDYKFEWSRLS